MLTKAETPRFDLDPLISSASICRMFGVTSRTLQRWILTERFPRPLKLSPRCLRWHLSEVRQHIAKLREVRS